MPHRRQPVAARLVAALGVLVALLVLPVAGAPGVAGLACAGAAPSGQVRIAVVIDFGTAGGPGGTRTTCVTVDADATGADALAAAATSLRWASSGLLCGIDGWPATGCGERGSSGYRYWAYSTGAGSSWSHSGVGPGFRTVRPGVVEGWRFVEGAGGPSDPPPRVAVASAVASCPQPSPAPAAPSAGGSAPAPAPAPAPQPPPTWGDAAPPPVWGGGGSPPPEAPPPPVPGEPGGSGSTAPLDEPAAGDDEAGSSPEDPDGAASDDASGASGSGGDDPGGASAGADGASRATELAAADTGGGASGIPWPTVAAATVIAVLGGVAALRFRTSGPRAGR